MDVQSLFGEKRILYLSRHDLMAAGILNYSAIVQDVRQGLCLSSQGKTINKKVAIDFDVDKDWKISALIGIAGPYAGVKWLGANTDNQSMQLPRSNSIIALNDRKTGRVLGVMVYFNAVGLPVLDIFVASRLFEIALEKNLGVLLGSQTPHWILTG